MTLLENCKMEKSKKLILKELNDQITCPLCKGYLVDATVIEDCLDVFCRVCIVKHFEEYKTECPKCHKLIKNKKSCLRADPQTQSVVYKLVPGLYTKEMQRREEFYRSTGVRASSSCSDDSVLERERDMINDQEDMISKYVGDKTQFFGPDDSISLSLEYYQIHLDNTSTETKSVESTNIINKNSEVEPSHINNGSKVSSDNNSANCDKDKNTNNNGDKRFLQCPAAVSMKHLQKFVRMKYGLTDDHKVDIIYQGEVLPLDFSLMDVAYSFKWKRTKPMRFFYRIFTPLKIRPIKIVNTTLSTGGKQLQIVPVKPTAETLKPVDNIENKSELPFDQETEDQKNHKEQLFAHLQLQSKSKVQNLNNKKVPEKSTEDCIFDYVEPDKEEIKRFAEKRDREWAMQKKLDETKSDYISHHFTKKRKKNKHSKNESIHKKRKLHAEITSNEEEDLKLKVKLTSHNGHKHKHHKSSQANDKTTSATSELSSKEKLLQMRQVRHKQVPSEDKNIQTIPTLKLPKESIEKSKNESRIRIEKPAIENKSLTTPKEKSEKKKTDVASTQTKSEPTKPQEVPQKIIVQKSIAETTKTVSTSTSTSEPSSSKNVPNKTVPIKTNPVQEWNKKIATVKIERNEQTEKKAQKTFLKTFQSGTDKCIKKNEKIQPNKIENQKTPQIATINTNNKLLERKIANLQQHCTIEAKNTETIIKTDKSDKKVSFNINNSINPQYPPGFTVSKIETGVKRKQEESVKIQDKRPSLEITLINPTPISSPSIGRPENKPVVPKRPPPATIPLERIKKSVSINKSGISIIPKLTEKCDNNSPLDLSNKSPENSPKSETIVNGFNRLNNSTPRPTLNNHTPTATEKNNIQLANLQMLSKVATEHHLNKNNVTNNIVNKNRQQIPNLQTIRIPNSQNPGGLKPTPNLAKMPKLNEINKFRAGSTQIRNLRPNQNQNIRNIPNPSLLNQNRLNSINSVQHNNSDNNNKDTQVKTCQNSTVSSATTNGSATSNIPPKDSNSSAVTTQPLKNVLSLDSKITEKKEISV